MNRFIIRLVGLVCLSSSAACLDASGDVDADALAAAEDVELAAAEVPLRVDEDARVRVDRLRAQSCTTRPGAESEPVDLAPGVVDPRFRVVQDAMLAAQDRQLDWVADHDAVVDDAVIEAQARYLEQAERLRAELAAEPDDVVEDARAALKAEMLGE